MSDQGAGRAHRQHDHRLDPSQHEDADSRGLYHRQHPATPPPRFSSPSRPRRSERGGDIVAQGVVTLGVAAAASAMVQSVVWVAMSVAVTLVYRGIIDSPKRPLASERWDDYATIISYLYFKDHTTFPELPDEGLVTPRLLYRVMAATFITNAIWFITSSVMMRQVRLGSARSVTVSVTVWAASTVAVSVVDVMLGTAMARDLALLQGWPQADGFPGNTTTLSLCPASIMIVALRGGVLLLANVGCMMVLLLRLSQWRKDLSSGSSSASGSPSATKRGPIDGFLYQKENIPSLGVQNPVFLADEVTAVGSPQDATPPSWVSFKPAQGEERWSGYHQGPDQGQPQGRPASAPDAGRRHDPVGYRRDDVDDVSHLSWMAEVDKHVDVRVRSVVHPSAPPHYRFGTVEAQRHSQPPPHGATPTGYPDPWQGQGSDTRLPRARVNPAAPQLPFIPPPDYSPPTPRRSTDVATGMNRGGGGGRDWDRGRVGPRSIRNDRY